MHDVGIIRQPWEGVQRRVAEYGKTHGLTVHSAEGRITVYGRGLAPIADFYPFTEEAVKVIYNRTEGLSESLGISPA